MVITSSLNQKIEVVTQYVPRMNHTIKTHEVTTTPECTATGGSDMLLEAGARWQAVSSTYVAKRV